MVDSSRHIQYRARYPFTDTLVKDGKDTASFFFKSR